ncbi:FecR domain-containing protein [Haloferula sp. BvORR071]|uniref:FecR domain-containing protein n=1 Tax=Haloferula sp. BvORR071 TaxID=1396141 RepID=UPI0005507F0E|nr:FecR domain-containing protein [Haloferula sp. BvORR071]
MNQDWQKWIERLKSYDLTEAELREFQAAIEKDPAQRDAYLDALLTEVGLEAEDLPNPFAKPEAPVVVPFRRWPRIAAIAAGIALVAAASYLAGQRLTVKPAAATHVATITDADELAENAGMRIGQPLEKGSFTVPDGSEIGIAMRGGARLKVRGPADFQIDGPDKIRLGKGRISTYAPTYAHGFTVDTTDGKVVDLGTRFVTAAGTPSGTEVHVLEGLVEAFTAASGSPHSLKGENAAILKGGKLVSTEFLAQRLIVPLDPVLADQDGDGSPDVVEDFYGTKANDASSKPAALRIEESFASYPTGPFRNASFTGPQGKWEGTGVFEPEGLSFAAGGASLKSSGGALSTTGETNVGATLRPDPKQLSPQGVTYLSFLMRNPDKATANCFAGLILYQDDREELFIGKLSVANSYGSRLKQSLTQDAFGLPLDGKPHLFVVRIDRTRLVTDLFLDPVPGQPESSATRQFRYQDVPDFDRIVLRSGSGAGVFPSTFDEIRIGLTWDAVVP